jgi:hypothetical protein
MNELIPLKTICQACQGEKYLPTGQTFVLAGRTHNRLGPCAACEGSGKEIRWVDLGDFANMLVAIQVEKQPA